ncbi:MAG: hypothetical protein PHF86_15065 [Candidatus Nanoarchaeia archaeon]|jgi:hypothetical protein|nr:hypothetical protein [Candidatus Nanoarchaeia archaeon]
MDKFNNYYFKEAEEKSEKIDELKIFIDLDGVLTNFTKALDDLKIKEKGMTQDEFWAAIKDKGGISFWEDMEWLPNAKKLWNHVKNHNPTILTSPARSTYSKEGKMLWIARELGKDVPYVFDRDKFKYATQNSILIDNEDKNIKDWVKYDGIGILHKYPEKTIEELKRYGF